MTSVLRMSAPCKTRSTTAACAISNSLCTQSATGDYKFLASQEKTGIDQNDIIHSLDKVVSNRFQQQNFLVTIKVDICCVSTAFALLPPSMLPGPAGLPSVPPHSLVVAHREG